MQHLLPMIGWSWPVSFGLLFVGTISGGLLGHALLNFVLAWRRPASPLLPALEVVKGGFTLPRIWPVFRVVGRTARALAPHRAP